MHVNDCVSYHRRFSSCIFDLREILIEFVNMEIEEARKVMSEESDVKRVVEIERLAGGGYRYFIETPFVFPKFVIGTTTSDLDVTTRRGFGEEWNARRNWDK